MEIILVSRTLKLIILMMMAVIGAGQSSIAPFRKLIVNMHNNYRRTENAADMKFMSWSPMLEQEAAQWTQECFFDHQLGGHGENLYFNTARRPNAFLLRQGLRAWYQERQRYQFSVDCKNACHYTQMVWRNSTEIGCAFSRCRELFTLSKSYHNAWYMVCFYEPQGNLVGQYPYTRGTPCSRCGRTDVCRNKLCLVPEHMARQRQPAWTGTTANPGHYGSVAAWGSATAGRSTAKPTTLAPGEASIPEVPEMQLPFEIKNYPPPMMSMHTSVPVPPPNSQIVPLPPPNTGPRPPPNGPGSTALTQQAPQQILQQAQQLTSHAQALPRPPPSTQPLPAAPIQTGSSSYHPNNQEAQPSTTGGNDMPDHLQNANSGGQEQPQRNPPSSAQDLPQVNIRTQPSAPSYPSVNQQIQPQLIMQQQQSQQHQQQHTYVASQQIQSLALPQPPPQQQPIQTVQLAQVQQITTHIKPQQTLQNPFTRPIQQPTVNRVATATGGTRPTVQQPVQPVYQAPHQVVQQPLQVARQPQQATPVATQQVPPPQSQPQPQPQPPPPQPQPPPPSPPHQQQQQQPQQQLQQQQQQQQQYQHVPQPQIQSQPMPNPYHQHAAPSRQVQQQQQPPTQHVQHQQPPTQHVQHQQPPTQHVQHQQPPTKHVQHQQPPTQHVQHQQPPTQQIQHQQPQPQPTQHVPQQQHIPAPSQPTNHPPQYVYQQPAQQPAQQPVHQPAQQPAQQPVQQAAQAHYGPQPTYQSHQGQNVPQPSYNQPVYTNQNQQQPNTYQQQQQQQAHPQHQGAANHPAHGQGVQQGSAQYGQQQQTHQQAGHLQGYGQQPMHAGNQGYGSAYQTGHQTSGQQPGTQHAPAMQVVTQPCVDKDVNCAHWSMYCTTNNYVTSNCLSTCRRCQGKSGAQAAGAIPLYFNMQDLPDGAAFNPGAMAAMRALCKDKDARCPQWSMYCSLGEHIEEQCPKTCRVCW